ncbi:OmpA family protein [Bacillus shivajii]|uniref:OmpA family protein n=1 Tax=Bacillus shivajii TaxID=1983719 RepID=UPI001CFA0256|nr:OmpA family protein [Bacillus shivajii]UCZ53404.1 OmpA family protein [Bacillus shivajii]
MERITKRLPYKKQVRKLSAIGGVFILVGLLASCINTSDSVSDVEQMNEEDSDIVINEEAKGVEEGDSIPTSTVTVEPFLKEIKEMMDVSTITGTIPTSRAIVTEGIDGSSQAEIEMIETLSKFNAVDIDLGTLLTLPGSILFDFDDDNLRPEADEVIHEIVQVIEATDGAVHIAGHTDNHGSLEYNEDLSKRRAEAVLEALVDAGVDETRLTAEGFGETKPIARNRHADGSDNQEGRQKNRRVEVSIEGLTGSE